MSRIPGGHVFWQINFLLALFVDGYLLNIPAILFYNSIIMIGFRGKDFCLFGLRF